MSSLRSSTWWTFSWCPATSLVHAFISCRLDYCNALLYGIADCQLRRLQSAQNAAARLAENGAHHADPEIFAQHCTGYRFGNGWLTSWQLWCTNALMVALRSIPSNLAKFCHPSVDCRPGMRSGISWQWKAPRAAFADFIWWQVSFAIAGPRTWNNLPDVIGDSSLSFLTFTKLLKSYLFVWLQTFCRACDI